MCARLAIIITVFMNLLYLSVAAVKPGENILLNPRLEVIQPDLGNDVDQMLAPNFWNVTGYVLAADYRKNGAPDGKGSIRLHAPSPEQKTPETTFRQSGLNLVAGETYRLSALVRTKDFVSSTCGMIVMNDGWQKDAGIEKFPKNQDWTRVSQDITMMPSPSGKYSFVVYACKFQGSIEFADFKLEALSAKAQAETTINTNALKLNMARLIPWSPLLDSIIIPPNAAQARQFPEMTFRFFGILPEGTAIQDYDAVCTINGKTTVKAPVQSAMATFQLKDCRKPGPVTLAVSLVERKTGKAIYSRTHSGTLLTAPVIDRSAHKRLNNLVVELKNTALGKTSKAQTVTFSTFRNGWVFIAAQNAASDKLEIILDGKTTVITSKTDRLETFRNISAGTHKLSVKGATRGGRIIVRSIPEIYNYCPGINNYVDTNPPYDWNFQKKYVLPSVTTQNGGKIPEEHRKEFADAGYRWVANMSTRNLTGETLVEKLTTCDGLNAPQYSGISCDEQGFNDLPSLLPYIEGLRNYVPKNDRDIYNWIVNFPTQPGIHHDFLAESLNVAGGHGRILTEVYCPTFATLKEAQDYLNFHIVKSSHHYSNFYPNTVNQWGIILGNYNQIPILSLVHHPSVDYKYYLDMQFNLIANHPDCKDMGITGYWGSYYADHELHRWAFMLTRHYCVEGKKTMLSDEYGLSYIPGHIRNGDFENNCDGWTITGNISAGRHNQYGKNGQDRYNAPNGIGDTMAVFTKKGNEVSSVTQTARNLIPGKTYCLQFFTADYNDVKANRINPRQNGLAATLGDGAKIDQASSWLFVDKRIQGRYAHNNGVARGNFHHIVFTATKPEVVITIDNAKAAAGEVLCCNCVSLNPYLPAN